MHDPTISTVQELKAVRAAARRGAASVGAGAWLARAAEEDAILRYENAVLAEKRIARLEAWAFRVGANAAKRLGARRVPVSLDGLASESQSSRTERLEPLPTPSLLDHGGTIPDDAMRRLPGRQLMVLRELQPQEAIRANARRQNGEAVGGTFTAGESVSTVVSIGNRDCDTPPRGYVIDVEDSVGLVRFRYKIQVECEQCPRAGM